MRLVLWTLFALTGLGLYAQTEISIPFIWSNSELNGEFFAKTAMHVPVRFPNDSTVYYFQFDTGANKSYLYIGEDSTTVLKKPFTHPISISSDIGLLHLVPQSSKSTYTRKGKLFVGTIGADFLANKRIEIDFINQQIYILTSYKASNYELQPCEANLGRPILTITVKGKPFRFIFDTGSSLFDIWTSRRLWKKWKKPEGTIQAFPIQSWGRMNDAYKATIDLPIFIGSDSSYLLTEVWYNSNKKFKRMFKKAKVSGIIGNKPFLNGAILIDLVDKQIGVKKVSNKN